MNRKIELKSETSRYIPSVKMNIDWCLLIQSCWTTAKQKPLSPALSIHSCHRRWRLL